MDSSRGKQGAPGPCPEPPGVNRGWPWELFATSAILVLVGAIIIVRLMDQTSSEDTNTGVPAGPSSKKELPSTFQNTPPQNTPPSEKLDRRWQEILAETKRGVDFGNFDFGTHKKKAVYKDLMLPRDYGYSTWSGLEERLRRNLMQQLVDLAMVLQAQGQHKKARAAAREALSIVLAYAAPADPGVANWWQTAPKSYTADAVVKMPLEERLRSALAKGWFGSAALSYISLLPAGTNSREDPAEFSLHVKPKPGTAAGVRWLLAARRRRSRGDIAGGTEAARVAFDHLHQSADKLLKKARARPRDLFLAHGNHYIGGDPFIRGFPWGWLSVDFVLRRLSSYIKEAAKLTQKDNTTALAKKINARIDDLLKDRQKPGKEGMPHWTSQRALTTVPT